MEERLKFYDCGEAPRKNITVMQKVAAEIAKETDQGDSATGSASTPSERKKKKRSRSDDTTPSGEAPSSKKKKKRKKSEKE